MIREQYIANGMTLGFIALFFVITAFFTPTTLTPPEEGKSAAEAKKHSNVYVFIESEPLTEYEEIGTIKLKVVSSCEWSDIRDKLVKKALKEYPDAEGIIVDHEFNASVIKFKTQ